MKKILFLATMLVAFASLADAQIIGSTNSATSPHTPKVDNSPLYRPTGSYIRFSGGYPTLLTAAYNYQLTPSFMFGGGVGLGCVRRMWMKWIADEWVFQNWMKTDPQVMPIYAEAEFRTPRYRWSMFLNIKVGYSLFTPEDIIRKSYDGHYADNYSPWLIAVTTGASYKNLHLGVGVSNVVFPDEDSFFSFFLAYSLPFNRIKHSLF